MSTPTKSKPRRYFGNTDPRCVIPPSSTAAPKPVRDASKRVAEAHERLDAARRDVAGAKAEIAQAAVADRTAARAAASAGKPLPEPVEPKAKAAVETALRELAAHEDAVRNESIGLARAVAEGFDAWHPKQLAAVEQAAAHAGSLIADLIEAVDQLEAERAVLAGLEQTGDSGSLVGVSFNFPPDIRRRRAKLEARQRDSVALGGDSARLVDRELVALLVALQLEVEGVKRGTPSKVGRQATNRMKDLP